MNNFSPCNSGPIICLCKLTPHLAEVFQMDYLTLNRIFAFFFIIIIIYGLLILVGLRFSDFLMICLHPYNPLVQNMCRRLENNNLSGDVISLVSCISLTFLWVDDLLDIVLFF